MHLHNVYHHLSPAILRTLHDRGVPAVLTAHDLKIACPAYQMHADDGICERCRGGRIHNVVRKRCIKGSLALSSVVFAETAVHRLLGTYTKRADKIVTSSAFYLEKFVEWGFDRDLFVRNPNHVSTDTFRPANEPGGAGFSSEENRRYLQRAGGNYILGEKLRSGSPEATAALARQGRYQSVTGNLQVKEVVIDDDFMRDRFVICRNPEQAERDKIIRDQLVA